MKHFSVLLVDDDQRDILDLAKLEFPTDFPVRLRTARDMSSADELLNSDFFHLALVDPRLDPQDDDDFNGFLVLENLKRLRPSCERIILTHLGRKEFDAEPIVLQLHPTQGVAQGVLMKLDVIRNFCKVIKDRAERWLSNPLAIDGAGMVAQRLNELFRHRNRQGELKTNLTEDEIDFLVSRVFGQGQLWANRDGEWGIRRVELELIPRQGFSLAAVLKARCFSGDNVQGILCVLKFAAREYVDRELVRYSQYVRYHVPVPHRVELLGWEFGDNLGVLCYNFAGVTSLSDLFLKQSRNFFAALNDMFSKDKKSWYKEGGLERLAQHFHTHYGVDGREMQGRIRDFVTELEKQFRGHQHGKRSSVGGVTLNLPGEVLGKAIFTRQSPACIVHGDLHCDNVLVDEDAKAMLIDYFGVAHGPRSLDFATLEASVRLLGLLRIDPDGKFVLDLRPDTELIPELLSLGEAEEAVWKEVWGKPVPANPSTDLGEVNWVNASIRLGQLARENFPEEKEPPRPPLSEEEYAATCLMWAMRLFKVKDLVQRDLTRLLVWTSFLVQVLKKS